MYCLLCTEIPDQNPKVAFTQNSMDSNPVDLFYQDCFVSCVSPENLCVLLASYLLAIGIQREVQVHVRTSIYLLLVSVVVCTFFP